MGTEIDRDTFSDEDYARFAGALARELGTLEQLLDRPGFGAGPSSIGLELELNLVNTDGRPAPINRQVLAQTMDPRVTLELNRFNLEINTRPELLGGTPFSALSGQLDDALQETARAASLQGAEVVAVGILPTLTERDLTSAAMTRSRRYQALNAGLKRLRREAFSVEIKGEDRLALTANDVTLEGAATSLQVHLRPPHDAFVQHFNAALAATGPALAVACNSPIFLERRLWQETRIALFRQCVDDRLDAVDDDWRPARVSFGHGWLRRSALEPFAESVTLYEPLLPALQEQDLTLGNLRLHQSTVWHWTRAIYDPTAGGHLRIELRALPAGPSVPDMIGNAALVIGLALGLAPTMEKLMHGLTFGHARRNFYQAACYGLDAELVWPDPHRGTPRTWRVRELFEHLLPVAERGLTAAGVSHEEAARTLGIVHQRVQRGVTGASWQRRLYDRLIERQPRAEAGLALLSRYRTLAQSGQPICAWPEP